MRYVLFAFSTFLSFFPFFATFSLFLLPFTFEVSSGEDSSPSSSELAAIALALYAVLATFLPPFVVEGGLKGSIQPSFSLSAASRVSRGGEGLLRAPAVLRRPRTPELPRYAALAISATEFPVNPTANSSASVVGQTRTVVVVDESILTVGEPASSLDRKESS